MEVTFIMLFTLGTPHLKGRGTTEEDFFRSQMQILDSPFRSFFLLGVLVLLCFLAGEA